MPQENNNIALLIDADNSPEKSIQFILSELARNGKVTIRKAYGNWTSGNLKGWEAILQEHAIQQYDLTKGKNATDIAMTIDAMDMLYTKEKLMCFAWLHLTVILRLWQLGYSQKEKQ